MNEQEYKQFLAWFSNAVGVEDQAKLESILDNMTEEEQDDVLAEWYRFSNNIIKAEKGMKCPKGMIPNYLQIGGKISQCGCKKPKLNLNEAVLKAIKVEINKCGGKLKKR